MNNLSYLYSCCVNCGAYWGN